MSAIANALDFLDAPDPQDKSAVEVIDGYLIAEGGEVLGLAPSAEADRPFGITDRDSAEWVMSKLADEETEILAIQTRKERALYYLDRQIAAHARRLNWLHLRFDAEMGAFAREQLAGTKARTYQLDNGEVRIRASKGTNTIRDMEKAVAFVKRAALVDRVKVKETVTVADVLAAMDEHIRLAEQHAANVAERIAIEESRGRFSPAIDIEADRDEIMAGVRERLAAVLDSTGPRDIVTVTPGILGKGD